MNQISPVTLLIEIGIIALVWLFLLYGEPASACARHFTAPKQILQCTMILTAH